MPGVGYCLTKVLQDSGYSSISYISPESYPIICRGIRQALCLNLVLLFSSDENEIRTGRSHENLQRRIRQRHHRTPQTVVMVGITILHTLSRRRHRHPPPSLPHLACPEALIVLPLLPPPIMRCRKEGRREAFEIAALSLSSFHRGKG